MKVLMLGNTKLKPHVANKGIFIYVSLSEKFCSSAMTKFNNNQKAPNSILSNTIISNPTV